MLSIICAVADNGAIGRNNQLLYHLRADLQRFKALTTGHTVVMGRRTFESLPKGALPNRRNIVLSRQPDFSAPGVEVFASLEEALRHIVPAEEAFIIGGASVYAEALPLADRLYLTEVHASPADADVFFPDFDAADWQLLSAEKHGADAWNEVPFHFSDYVRRD